MNENQSFSSVVKIIKDYVNRRNGDVIVPELIEDYYESFRCDIPFKKFGYNTLIDFLISITGLSVIIYDEEYHIQTRRWPKSTNLSEPALFELPSDISLLCVEMQNDLRISDSAAKRTVTLKESKLSPFNHSENQALKRYNSSYSVQTGSGEYVASSGHCSENYSATNSSFDLNSTYNTVNDYTANSFEPEFISVADQYSNDPEPTNYAFYDSQLQPAYDPQFSFYDSSVTPQNQMADFNSTFRNEQCDPFSHLSSENYNGFYSTSDIPENTNFDFQSHLIPVSEKQLINRLVVLVNAHQKKITSSAVEFQYIDSYSDALPKNWLTLLDESGLLFIEHLASGTIIYPNRTLSTTPNIPNLPKLDLPGQMPWSVSITVIRSVDSIWFRLNENDLDRRYIILCQQMRKHYQDMVPEKVVSVQVQQLFVAKLKNRLLRVCVLDRFENGTCKCLAIDEGVEEILPLTCLMALHEKFTNTPKLILQGSLIGLNKYAECSHIRDRLEKVVAGMDTSIVVEKTERGKFMINLLVTEALESDSVNVNDYLLNVVNKELNLPKLKMNKIFDVLVLSLALDENVAKIQIRSPCLELLQQSLQKCKHIIDCTDKRLLFARNLIDVQLNQVYLAKYSDGSWQRVLIKQFVSSTHAVVVFVDFQDIQALEIAKIVSYANFPDALTYIPPQGVTVNIVKTDHEVLKLMNVKLKTNIFSMKVVQTDPKLYVQMYMKAPQEICDGEIINVNFEQFRCSAV